MALPVDVRDLVKSGTELRKERERPVHLAALVEVDAPDALIDAVRRRLLPQTIGARVTVAVAEHGPAQTDASADALIVLAGGGGPSLRSAIDAAKNARVRVVVLAIGDAGRGAALADALGQPLSDLLVSEDVEDLVTDRLARWLIDEVSSKRLALAHNFAFVRRAAAEEAVSSTAWQNALIGTVAIIPGADMPLMTANQAKMLLQIAAAYGEQLGADRLKELAAVVGAGFAFRTIARQAVGVVPVLGWAVKGGFGYAGTVAMGRAAIRYFEQGADLSQVVEHMKESASEARGRLASRPRVLSRRHARQQAQTEMSVPATLLPPALPPSEGGAAE